MSKHTEGQTPTTGCGCRMEPVDDRTVPCDLCSEATGMFDGVGWRIHQCPMHAAAPEMLEAARYALAVLAEHEQYENDPAESAEAMAASLLRAALARAEGRDAP